MKTEGLSGILWGCLGDPIEKGASEAWTSASTTVSRVFTWIRNKAETLYERLGRVFSSAKREDWNKQCLTKVMDLSDKRVTLIREHFKEQQTSSTASDNSAAPTIPAQFFLSQEEKDCQVKAKKTEAELAFKRKGEFVNTDRLCSRYNNTVTRSVGYGFEELDKMRSGRIVPSYNIHAASASSGANKHLINCYKIFTPSNALPIIRSGVIDSETKANEFAEVALKDFPPRVVSNQLCSPETEMTMVKRQHEEISKLNSTLREYHTDVAHILTPTNRLYYYAKMIQSIPLVGSWIEKRSINGELYAREQNATGWATYLKWLGEDIQKEIDEGKWNNYASTQGHLSAFKDVVRNRTEFLSSEIQDLVLEVRTIRNSLDNDLMDSALREATQEKIHTKEHELSKKRKELSSSISEHILPTLRSLEEFLACKPKTELSQKIQLTHLILMNQLGQLGQKKLGKGKESMLIDLLNEMLHVVSAVNCKSGLDRTGFAISRKSALRQLTETIGQNRVLDMVLNWGETKRKINKLLNSNDPNEVERFEEHLKKMSEGKEKTRIKDVCEFRKLVLQNLLALSMEPTKASTGVTGFKWGKGYAQNLQPVNFLPPWIRLEEEGEAQKLCRLVHYNKNGSPQRFTSVAHDLLLQDSALRGA